MTHETIDFSATVGPGSARYIHVYEPFPVSDFHPRPVFSLMIPAKSIPRKTGLGPSLLLRLLRSSEDELAQTPYCEVKSNRRPPIHLVNDSPEAWQEWMFRRDKAVAANLPANSILASVGLVIDITARPLKSVVPPRWTEMPPRLRGKWVLHLNRVTVTDDLERAP